MPIEGLANLELQFDHDELVNYTKYRKTELTRKSADWINRAAVLTNAAPQVAQNLASGGLSPPQFIQNFWSAIQLPERVADQSACKELKSYSLARSAFAIIGLFYVCGRRRNRCSLLLLSHRQEYNPVLINNLQSFTPSIDPKAAHKQRRAPECA